MLDTEDVVSEQEIKLGVDDLLAQCTPLFMEQICTLTNYQLNFLRAIIDGQHNQWTSQEVLSKYQLGTKSSIIRIQKTLIEKDFVEQREDGFYLADPVLQIWLQQH